MNERTDANAILAPIWRRKWLILAVGIVVAAGSYVYYKHERPLYQSTTQIYLGAGAEEQAAGEKAGRTRGSVVGDEAAVINTIVVEQVRRRLRAEGNPLARTGTVKAKAPEKSEFLAITAEAHSARDAALLANLTAQGFVRRQADTRRQGIENAIAIDRRQLRRIEAANLARAEKPKTATNGKASAPASSAPSASSVIQEATLSSKINQLESSLGSSTAQQVKPANPQAALMLSPKPRKDAIFGFVLGLVLAAIAAYAFGRLDRRLRSLATIESVIGLPLLSALPKVRQPVVRGAHTPRPSVRLLEPLRRLQTGLQMSERPAPAEPGGRVILFVSPDPGDGKSTVVADLALVQRDAGERVMVVEANFRRPVQTQLLGLDGDGRLAAVLAGRLDIDEAAQRVTPALHSEASADGNGGVGVATVTQTEVGSLFALAGDRSVANPQALLTREAVGDLFRTLVERFDYVLVDAPSPLEVSDVIPLIGIVDQIVVVARAGHSREASAERLRQLLERPSCAPVAGVVANFVSPGDLKRYGFTVDGRIWQGGRPTAR
ncbi:MAG TPA: Wzz/FepE/Etk N-terminal domain-containing protein [Solirubrobacteraceae bacterium]|jgi:Mrp family chromosome partitioning ATPase|nr:Wzz/FepE/Etk N-terminal domain-containing protein [Solirubrobacteraceae bacterium]